MAGADTPSILHADLDAFYASVEQLLEPSLRGKPIAVGASVVLAASYEARAFGVSAGMAGWRARQLCPGLRFVGGHFGEYQRLGDAVIDILGSFTPRVERVSIDEAFLDVTGATHLFGPPQAIAQAIRRRVRAEVGLPLSVGAARTKHLAKIASQVAKPDGMVVVTPAEERTFLERLPVGLIWGVGPATREQLARVGVHTIGQLAAVAPEHLAHLLGTAAADKLVALAGNVDPRRVTSGGRARSIGAQAALGRRVPTRELLHATLGYLADRVASRLRAAGRGARTVTVRVRFADLRAVTRSRTLPSPVSATSGLTALAVELAAVALADHPGEREISLLGVSASQLAVPSAQLELPFDAPGARCGARPAAVARRTAGAARGADGTSPAVDRSVDAIRTRFGRSAIGYAAVVLSGEEHVPEAFRQLAERSP